MLVKVETYYDGEFWCARGIGEDIFTQGENLDELMGNIKEAAALYCDERLQQGEDLHILVLSEVEIKSASKTPSS